MYGALWSIVYLILCSDCFLCNGYVLCGEIALMNNHYYFIIVIVSAIIIMIMHFIYISLNVDSAHISLVSF